MVSAFRFSPLYVRLVGQAYNSTFTERIPGEPVLLVREPANPHDANAVAVFNALNGQPDAKIGYIKARHASPPTHTHTSHVTYTPPFVCPFIFLKNAEELTPCQSSS